MTSPAWMPAAAARPSGLTSSTSRPCASFGARAFSASSGVSGATATPSAVLSSLAPGSLSRVRAAFDTAASSSFTVRCFSAPSRTTATSADDPGPDAATRLRSVLVSAVANGGRPPLRADDPHRHRLADAERVADREDHVADSYVLGVADGDWAEVAGRDLQQREVARLVGADELCRQGAVVGQFD